jgi:hypothetical protein
MTDRPHPTPSRLALLDEVAAGNVFRDAIGHNYISAGRKVTAEMRDMEAAGWVALLPGDEPRTWQLTPYGRAIAAVRILDFGDHLVAETGDPDQPRHLGDATPAQTAPKWLWNVRVGDAETAVRRKHWAREELRHMAATRLAAEPPTTVPEGPPAS